MPSLKYIVPALALAGSAFAQSTNTCSVAATSTVSSAAQITAIQGCPTFSGSIALATSLSGAVAFDGVTKITGSLTANGASNLTSLSGSTLQSIGGTLDLENLESLNTLSFPVLTSAGSITWITLSPQLQQLTFTTGLTSVGALNIQDTYLQTLTGINLDTATSINIANNRYLATITMQLKSVSGLLAISANHGGAVTASFPNLVTAGSIDISNCSSLDISSLSNVTGAASFTGNGFTTLSAPNLTYSLGLTIDNNDDLTNFTLPVYASSGGALSVQNNTALTGTIAFPDLTKVTGAALIRGVFTAVSMPDLNTIAGAMTIVSTKNIAATCSHFQALSGLNNDIEGTFTCSGASTSTTAAGSTATGTSASTSTATKKSDAGSYQPASATAFSVFGGLAALFALMM